MGIWPAGFDKDDVMWCNTSFGDYPHYLPFDFSSQLKLTSEQVKKQLLSSQISTITGGVGSFTGWMLLNYKKSIMVSSTLGSYSANNVNDESMKTYWSAATANKGEWIQTDLGNLSTVNAIQINYADQDAEFLGKIPGLCHQYKLYYSVDGMKWNILADKSNNKTDRKSVV